MKKIYLLTILIPMALLTQSFYTPEGKNSIKSVMKDFRHESGFMHFSVPAFIVRPFIPEEEMLAKELLRDVKMFRILISQPEASNEVKQDLNVEMNEIFAHDGYKDMVTIKSNHDQVIIKAIEQDGFIQEIIAFISSEDETVLVQVTGKISLEKIGKSIEYYADCN